VAISIKKASVFAEGLDHPECLAFHPDGDFYAGGEAGQIYRISGDGRRVEEIANIGRWHITKIDLKAKGLPLACHAGKQEK